MKAHSTIKKQIRRLEKVSKSGAPMYLRNESYAAYHALRWVIEDVNWTPASLAEREAAKAGGKP